MSSADEARSLHNGQGAFKTGQFEDALRYFEAANKIKSTASTYHLIAKCHFNLNNVPKAVVCARIALQLDPVHVDARTALVESLVRLEKCEEALWHILVVRAISFDAVSASDWRKIRSAIMDGQSLALSCLKPVIIKAEDRRSTFAVSYARQQPNRPSDFHVLVGDQSGSKFTVEHGASTVLLGIGNKPTIESTFIAGESSRAAWGLRFENGVVAHQTLIGSVNNKSLVLADCEIGECHAGVLTEAQLLLSRVKIKGARSHCVEVRKGGRCWLSDCTFSDSGQGVAAYAGATLLCAERCVVENCLTEGFLLQGTEVNAASKAQQKSPLDQRRLAEGGASAKVAAAAAAATENSSSRLDASIVDCAIRKCTQYAVSTDRGAHVSIRGCEILETDKGVYIVGGTNVEVANTICSQWTRGAIYVGANYDGAVSVRDSVFAQLSKQPSLNECIVEESKLQPQMFARMGWHSSPVHRNNNKMAELKDVPPIDEVRKIRGPEAVQLQKMKQQAPAQLTSLPDLTRCTMYNDWSNFYPIGNTPGFCPFPRSTSGETRVFLGACGDIRNLLAWTEAMNGSDERTTLDITLSDHNPAVLARDVLLLHMIVHEQRPETVLAIWGDFCLEPRDNDALQRELSQLISGETSCDFLAALVDDEMRAALLPYWKVWKDNSFTAEDVQERRSSSLVDDKEFAKRFAREIGRSREEQALQHYFVHGFAGHGNIKQQIASHSIGNPTFFGLQQEWRVNSGSCIFRALELDNKAPLAEGLLRKGAALFSSFRAWANSARLVVRIECDDLVGSLLSTQRGYDAIDLSNCSDYLSIPALLVAARSAVRLPLPRLATPRATLQLMRNRVMGGIDDETRRAVRRWARVLGGVATMVTDECSGVTNVKFEVSDADQQGITPHRRALELLSVARDIMNSSVGCAGQEYCAMAAVVAAAVLVLPPSLHAWIQQSPGLSRHHDEMKLLFEVHCGRPQPDTKTCSVSTTRLRATSMDDKLFYNMLNNYRVVRLADSEENRTVSEVIRYEHATGRIVAGQRTSVIAQNTAVLKRKTVEEDS